MIKKILLAIITLIFMLTAVSCSIGEGTTKKYLDAMQKTEKADSYRQSSKLTLNLDLSKATEKTKKDLEKYKDITVNIDESVDDKNKISMSDQFLKAGDISFNIRQYINGDTVYLKFPDDSNKYIKIDLQDRINANAANEKVSNEFYQKTYKIWEDFARNELITDEGEAIENTADGDIKVTLLTIKLTDDKAKGVLAKIADVLSKDEAMKKSLMENQKMYNKSSTKDAETNKKVEEVFDNLPQYFEKYKDKVVVEDLKLTAKVDRDSYIISQVISGTISIKVDGEIKVKFEMNSVKSDINTGKIKIKIPDEVISNAVKLDESNFSNPEYMKKMFGNNK